MANCSFEKEELLVIVGVGLQTVTTYANSRCATAFYKATDIQDLVINEHVSMVSLLLSIVASSLLGALTT